MPNIQLADNLRFLRTKNEFTQGRLSSVLNISRQAYSNYENSKRTPDLDSLMRISRLYKVTLDQLVNQDLSRADLKSEGIADEKAPYILARDAKTVNTIYLTEDEIVMLRKIRSLNDEDRQVLAGYLSSRT